MISSRRFASFLGSAAALALATTLSGCDEPSLPVAPAGRSVGESAEGQGAELHARLLRRFPQETATLLAGETRFEASDSAYRHDAARQAFATRDDVDVILPRHRGDAVQFRGEGGFSLRVREEGIEAGAFALEGAVAYPRAGGASLWVTAGGGAEEWLALEPGAARAGEPVGVWHVEGAEARQDGSGIHFFDDGGYARLHVIAPLAHVEGGGPIKVRLELSGTDTLKLFIDEEVPEGRALLVDPSWTTLAPMNQGRELHTATLLQNGKVLVAGGNTTGNNATKFAELYDPGTNLWTFTGSMIGARYSAVATALSDGRVLVTGGYAFSYLATAEIYNPATGTFSAAASMNAVRSGHQAARLADGRVLVAGGHGGPVGMTAANLNSTEIYNPVTNVWTAGAPMASTRNVGAMVTLQSGKPLMIGGATSGVITAEAYDQVANTWSSAGTMNVQRAGHSAVVLANGKVLVVGTAGYGTLCELYDPATNAWSLTGSLFTGRQQSPLLLLPTGQVLVAGGGSGAANAITAELYDPALGSWTATASLNTSRVYHTGTLLANGKVMVAGGSTPLGSQYITGAELFTTVTPLACAAPGDCVSGQCVDGYCCDTACGGGAPGDCQACNVAGAQGVCTLLPASTTCRGAAGACDVAESCTGASAACPADVLAAAGLVCRAAATTCDVAETCAGNAAQCPADSLKVNGSACDDGNACTSSDSCQSGVCLGGSGVVCSALDACHVGGVCNPATGACTNPPKADGSSCDDGSLCTQTDSCQAGTCVGGNPKTCAALDACHTAGTCIAASGLCTNPPKANGAACDDSNLCTQTDSCQAGTCIGSNPLQCAALDGCHVAGVCNPMTGVCPNPPKADGSACNDGNLCTQGDACQLGSCVGSSSVTCAALDDCHAPGTCSPATGLCDNPAKANGVACNDGNLCTQSDSCQNGACLGSSPLICQPLSPCHVAGACNPATGVCSNPPKADGSACNDGSVCTGMDACQSGACVGSFVACRPADDCHLAGLCDAVSGCMALPKADGEPCAGGTCQSGACVSGTGGAGGGVGGAGGTGGTGGVAGNGGTGGTGGVVTTAGSGGATGTGAVGGAGGTGGGMTITSTETSAAGGKGGTGGTGGSSSSGTQGGAGGDSREEASCGCRVAGDEPGNAPWALGLAALLGLRRVRRRKAQS